jgi:phage shock protein PspC (stress-responsive transcriptional regulator)
MTETLPPPPSSGGLPPLPRRLVRRSDEKVVAGVCAAFARATDTDPVLWRVGIAVLSLFGGTGIALYVLGWLLVPKAGGGPTAVERALRQPKANLGTVIALVIGGLILLSMLDNGPGAGALLVIGGIAYLIARDRRDKGSAPVPQAYTPPLVMHGPDPAPSAWTQTGADTVATSTRVTPEPYDSGLTAPLGYGATYGGGYVGGSYDTSPFAAWDAGPPAPAPRRRKSPLGLLTLSAAAMLAGALLTLRATGIEEITVARILAAVLVVLGGGMIVGTWIGRARWLLLPSVLVAVALVPAALLQAAPGPFNGGIGERTWTPGPGERDTQFTLGLGEATLDLRQLDPENLDGRPLSVDLGAGEIVVLAPEGLLVRVDAEVNMGELVVRELNGDLRSLGTGSDERVERQFDVGNSDDPVVELDLQVSAGQIEVRRVAS